MTGALGFLLLLQVTPELRQHVEAGLQAKRSGDVDTAIREFKAATELAPNLAAAFVNLGAAYIEKKDFGKAVPPLEKSLQLQPDLRGAEGMLGAALLAQGYAAAAMPYLEKGQANDLLGVALLEMNRDREAVDHLEAALEKRPNDPDLLYYLSEAHVRLAKRAMDRLSEAAPNSARREQMQGETAAAAGNQEAARKYFLAALGKRPGLRGVHGALGESYLAAGDYERAETEFRAEVQVAPGSALAHYKLGSTLLNRGQGTAAIAELRQARQLQQESPEILLALGKALNMTGDARGAAETLEGLLHSAPDSAQAAAAHLQLAQSYRKLGRAADAERQMKLFGKGRQRPGR